MKKLLLATTALTLSAGVAAADVSLSGDARMGLLYDGSDVNLTSRARVTFTLSGETDSGMAFGGSFRADNAGGAAAGTAGSVFISGEFGRLAFGDVAGAARSATGDLHGVGLTGLGDRNEMQYVDRLSNGINGTAALALGANPEVGPDLDALTTLGVGFNVNTGLNSLPRALYTYSIDGFSVYASVAYSKSNRLGVTDLSLTDPVDGFRVDTALGLSAPVSTTLTEFSVGASYEIDGFMVAAGYEQARVKISGFDAFFGSSTVDGSTKLGHATLAAQYSMDGITAKAIYGRAMDDLADLVADKNQYGVSMSATFDATTVSAFARRDFGKTDHYGLGARYDLGGGAALAGGVAKSKGSDAVADLGLAFSF